MRDQRLHVQRTRGLKRGSRGNKGIRLSKVVVDCDQKAGGSMCFGAEWSFLPSLISADSYDQACSKLACGLLYRAGLDHMVNLQGRFVEIEMMGQAIWASCGILCIFGQPNNMRSRWWKADLHEPSSPTAESAAWVEGATGHVQVCCYQRRCSAAYSTYSSTVVGEEASKRPCHLPRGRPILSCDKKESLENLPQPDAPIILVSIKM